MTREFVDKVHIPESVKKKKEKVKPIKQTETLL